VALGTLSLLSLRLDFLLRVKKVCSLLLLHLAEQKFVAGECMLHQIINISDFLLCIINFKLIYTNLFLLLTLLVRTPNFLSKYSSYVSTFAFFQLLEPFDIVRV